VISSELDSGFYVGVPSIMAILIRLGQLAATGLYPWHL